MISSHSAAVEVSHQSLAGRITSPFSSSGTKPCCWPLTPMALTSARDGLGLAQRPANRAGGGIAPGVRMLLLGARRQAGNQIIFLRRQRREPCRLRASTTRTLVDCVPLSMPSKSVLIISSFESGLRMKEVRNVSLFVSSETIPRGESKSGQFSDQQRCTEGGHGGSRIDMFIPGSALRARRTLG